MFERNNNKLIYTRKIENQFYNGILNIICNKLCKIFTEGLVQENLQKIMV